MIRAIIVIASFFLLAGCSQTEDTEPLPDEVRELENVTVYPTDTQPEFDIQLSRERAFPGSEDFLLGKIVGVAADNRGNIYIADGEQATIHVFTSDGRNETQIGRSGRGPGEFGELLGDNTMRIDGNRLYVYDGKYNRINIFSTETFEYITRIGLIRSRNSNIEELKSSTPALDAVINEGLFVVHYFDIRNVIEYPESKDDISNRYYLVNKKGEITGDKIFEAPLPAPKGTGDLSRFSQLAVSADKKNLFTVHNEHLLVKIRDLNGNYLRAFYHPYENVELKSADTPSVEPGVEVPETLAALDQVLVDDQNRLWISTIVEDDEIYEWWVLEEDGELLARFDWPRDKEIEVIKNDRLYTLETEEETGLEEVVCYRIEMSN